jgi:2,4-dienoyl-CoA reductase-like NADH-dependent reductase (Old Yellow Enzyme family)
MMSKLFDPFIINGLELKNRFLLSAALGAEQPMKFARLAEGEVGLLITGGCGLDEISSFEQIIQDVHARGGKIALQLVTHLAGKFGMGGLDTIAVSALSEDNSFFNPIVKYSPHHPATEKEINAVIDSYVQAAVLARKIGADAVQIHSAHQSFLSQFLSPITNRRDDRWGGSIENRTRIHRAIYDSIRTRVGKNFPLLIKIGVEDALDNGLLFQEGKEIAKMLADHGFDALEISQGLQNFQGIFQNDWSKTPMKNKINCPEKEAYFRKWCKEIKSLVSAPLILTGGLRSIEMMQNLVDQKECDLLGLCRPLIREPDLIQRWRKKDRRHADCISCNRCIIDSYMNGACLECPLITR